MQLLNEKVDNTYLELREVRKDLRILKLENSHEHQLLKQMVKELDTEVVQLKRLK